MQPSRQCKVRLLPQGNTSITIITILTKVTHKPLRGQIFRLKVLKVMEQPLTVRLLKTVLTLLTYTISISESGIILKTFL